MRHLLIVLALAPACDDPGNGGESLTACEAAMTNLCDDIYAYTKLVDDTTSPGRLLQDTTECFDYLTTGPGAWRTRDSAFRITSAVGCAYDNGTPWGECIAAADAIGPIEGPADPWPSTQESIDVAMDACARPVE